MIFAFIAVWQEYFEIERRGELCIWRKTKFNKTKRRWYLMGRVKTRRVDLNCIIIPDEIPSVRNIINDVKTYKEWDSQWNDKIILISWTKFYNFIVITLMYVLKIKRSWFKDRQKLQSYKRFLSVCIHVQMNILRFYFFNVRTSINVNY